MFKMLKISFIKKKKKTVLIASITILLTLTVDDKYSLINRDNLTEPIQILLSEKQKAFS